MEIKKDTFVDTVGDGERARGGGREGMNKKKKNKLIFSVRPRDACLSDADTAWRAFEDGRATSNIHG